ncbi:sensor histidine kinase [Undibacterium sp. Ji83W]|uniref:sensor histidine kinase n=1 Tax=Undibacterium sp. Ji83W TaxID=3413043 RepID=UPI003BF0FB2A
MNFASGKTGDFIPASMTLSNRAGDDGNARDNVRDNTTSFFWLILLAWFLLKYTKTIPHTGELLMVIATLASFILLFEYSLRGDDRRLMSCIIAATITGILWAPCNAGAAAFVIVGVGMCSRIKNPRTAYAVLYIVCAMLLMANAAWQLPADFLIPTLLFCIPVGLASILLEKYARTDEKFLSTQEEIANHARLAERERISRDIHDVLGHTLSVIALKADLARKLIKTDLSACAHELIDIEHSARNTLREVRTTVRNCRASNLNAELSTAKKALHAAEINMISLIEQCHIPQPLENVIALSLREAVTNIIRHAKASQCKITLSSDSRHIRLIVADNGLAKEADKGIRKGSGLNGMTERVHALQGIINLRHANGLSIEILLPIKGTA